MIGDDAKRYYRKVQFVCPECGGDGHDYMTPRYCDTCGGDGYVVRWIPEPWREWKIRVWKNRVAKILDKVLRN